MGRRREAGSRVGAGTGTEAGTGMSAGGPSAGDPGGGAPALANVTYQGDTNLADPIVAPFVTKASATLTLSSPVDGLPGTVTTTPVTDSTLWGNAYGAAHGGVCASS